METKIKYFPFPLFPEATGLSGVDHNGGSDGRKGAGPLSEIVVTIVVLGMEVIEVVILKVLRMAGVIRTIIWNHHSSYFMSNPALPIA